MIMKYKYKNIEPEPKIQYSYKKECSDIKTDLAQRIAMGTPIFLYNLTNNII